MKKKLSCNEAENFRGFIKTVTDALKVNPEDVNIECSIRSNEKGKKAHCVSVTKNCFEGEN